MSEEYWFPIGEDIKKEYFWQEGQMSIRQLDRSGFCGHCTKKIHTKKEYVLTYVDHHNKMPRIILCQECIQNIINLFNAFNKNTTPKETNCIIGFLERIKHNTETYIKKECASTEEEMDSELFEEVIDFLIEQAQEYSVSSIEKEQ